MSNEHAHNVQASGGHRNHVDLEKIRRLMLRKIYDYLMFRKQQQSYDVSAKRITDLTRLLEKILYDAASTLDEYMNVDTLENRLITSLKQLRNSQNQNQQLQQQQRQHQVSSGFGNQNQQFVEHGNSWGNISTMIATPSGIGSASSSSNGYQQPTSIFPTTSGSNNMVSSMDDGERISSQMLPTPGFVNTNNTDTDRSLESSMVAGFQLLNL